MDRPPWLKCGFVLGPCGCHFFSIEFAQAQVVSVMGWCAILLRSVWIPFCLRPSQDWTQARPGPSHARTQAAKPGPNPSQAWAQARPEIGAPSQKTPIRTQAAPTSAPLELFFYRHRSVVVDAKYNLVQCCTTKTQQPVGQQFDRSFGKKKFLIGP